MASILKTEVARVYNVVLVSTLYLIFGLLSSFAINRWSFPLDTTQSKVWVFLQVIVEVAATIVLAYFIRNAIDRMPLPMLGDKKLQEQVLNQVRGGIVIAFAMFALQVKLLHKIQYIFFE